MKKIRVKIKGVAPLLQNRFAVENEGVNKSKGKKKVYVPEEEAEKALYRTPDGEIYEPSEHVLGSLIRAAVNFKFEGKKTFKDIIKGCLVIDDECLLLGKTEWDEIDTRAVVIQRARVLKWRPKFNDWELEFTMSILDDDLLAPQTLREILDCAGQRYGIGDYRPRFGRFQVVEWEELK